MPSSSVSRPEPLACTCFRLRRAAREISKIYDQALAGVGLSLNEYSILRHSRSEPRILGELALALGMDRSTLTRNLKPLIESGWLVQTPGLDARQRQVAITAAGRARLRLARPHWQRAQLQIQALFGEDRTRGLHHDLDELHERYAAQFGGPS
ncbi:MAG: MarR family winged helix-turn-helix transcriptional regulator [Gammaproteobacteria bacterium]|nr:MarR family winged helix-turn-helix transcriptional regulator [Gammaproteobacteria bacterium]